MKTSQQFLNDNPDKVSQNQEFLQLAKQIQGQGNVSTGPHEVILISDEEGERRNPRTNQVEKVIWFIVKENDIEKKYAVPMFDKKGNIHYLIQRLGELPEGTEVVLEYKRKPNSPYEGYINVQVLEKSNVDMVDFKGDSDDSSQDEEPDIDDILF